jgi:signal recognition particle subunit SRP54
MRVRNGGCGSTTFALRLTQISTDIGADLGVQGTDSQGTTMFENLQERFGRVLTNLRGQGRLTEDNIKDTMREVRMALLEADVALPVVRQFVEQVREKALGEEVMKSLTPGQVLIKIVNDELVALMGAANERLDLTAQPPAVVLMAGLQGSGKTTSVAKLARWLQEKQNKSVLVVSCDVYRPAAIEQLRTVAAEVGAGFIPSSGDQNPVDIARNAVDTARKQFKDVLIVDTAGRLHVDGAMMEEIKAIHAAIRPVETLFVVDAMTGQDAANTARAFDEALPLTGIILTKTDGDARGGAALSIRQITGKPIKFLGVGEKTTALEPFHPDRVASRILGMGDVISLVEEVQSKVDREQAERLVKKLKKGKDFDLADFREQLEQMANMGGMANLMEKLPGMNQVPEHMKNQVNDKEMGKLVAIINSMTPQERQFPAIIKGSRRRRIAMGSGTQVQDVNKLLKQFTQMQKMMKKMKGGGMAKMMRALGGRLPGAFPGGLPGGGMPPGGFRM